MKLGFVAAAMTVMSLSPALAADAPNKEQCDGWFMKADTNKDGTLGGDELKMFADRMGLTQDNKDLSGIIVSKVDWTKACEEGKFGMPS